MTTTTQTSETQRAITPAGAVELLKEGNARFSNARMAERDLLSQVRGTVNGQYPFATVLSCIDSRVSAELVFDQGIGDVFSARVAGNIVNEDLLGSMEFACKLAGTRAVVVLGHTSCGAVKGACDNAELGNLTQLLQRLKPAVGAVKEPASAAERNSKNEQFVDAVAEANVRLTVENIRRGSEVLAELEADGKLAIVGAMYDLKSGKVNFLQE